MNGVNACMSVLGTTTYFMCICHLAIKLHCICLSRGLERIERRDISRKLLGSERALVLGNGLILAAIRAGGKQFC